MKINKKSCIRNGLTCSYISKILNGVGDSKTLSSRKNLLFRNSEKNFN